MGGLIPLRDASPEPKRYPMVTTSLIVVNVLVFLLELAGGKAFVRQWLVIPAEIAAGRHRITILAAMFMHTGWMHIIGNMVFLFHASETQFHTGWFVESLMTQTLVLFVIRTAKTPLESRPSGLLIATCLAVVGTGIYLPFSSFAGALGLTRQCLLLTLCTSVLRRWSIS